jgi:hypothetical protein
MSGTRSTSNGEGWLVVAEALALPVCNVAGDVSRATLDVPAGGMLLPDALA